MKRLIAVIIFLSFLSINSILADTITVSGDVYGTWSADTVLVEGEVRVPVDSTLTIEPGVKVLFQTTNGFIVDEDATLIAVGTESDSILFANYTAGIQWENIVFTYASDSAHIKYCHITNTSGPGIYVDHTALLIENSLIDSCSGAIYCFYAGGTIINESRLANNSTNGNGGGVYSWNSTILISNNMIDGNSASVGGGIYCFHQIPQIIGNTITNNTFCGVYLDELAYDIPVTDNIISNNNGAGILTYSADPLIIGNEISGNSAEGITIGTYSYPLICSNVISYNQRGIDVGGNCFPSIINNIICYNSVNGEGGGIKSTFSGHCYIFYNIIVGNTSTQEGGGISCSYQTDVVGNIICGNSSSNDGGGIYCDRATDIVANFICGNTAADHGGGIASNGTYSVPTVIDVDGNVICHNIATADEGGGVCAIYFGVSPVWDNNTIYGNTANSGGSGLYIHALNNVTHFFHLRNSVVWGNNPTYWPQIIGPPSDTVTYCDVQGGWEGVGNIDLWPEFVDPHSSEFRLMWDSPCIDAGDPNPLYNNPDGTRCDMGAFYFDQSVPVRILLSPHEIPYLIEPEGGTMDYTIRATNIYQSSHQVTVWCDVELPDSTVYGPVLGPVTITIEPGQTIERMRTQTVPASAPMGVYHYNAYAVVDSDTSKDSFMFGKLGTIEGGMDGWGNAGDPLIEIGGGSTPALRGTHVIVRNYPNPFNPVTVIGFTLPEASLVTLEIYDVAGRFIESALHSWRDAGVHEVTFDGSDLASGVYVYRLEAGGSGTTPTTEIGKMVMMK